MTPRNPWSPGSRHHGDPPYSTSRTSTPAAAGRKRARAALAALLATFAGGCGEMGFIEEGDEMSSDESQDSEVLGTQSFPLLNVNNEFLLYANRTTWTTPFAGAFGTFFADTTGDGKADAIAVNPDRIYVRPANATGTSFLPIQNWTGEPFRGERGTFFADITGDGKADAIALDENGIRVRRAGTGGTVFVASQQWSTSAFYGEHGTFFADVTGDGKADAIAVNDEAVYVRRSTGTLFMNVEVWTTNPFIGQHVTTFGDVTGDGKADAVAVSDTGVFVRRSLGTSFANQELWTGSFYGDVATFITDASADGIADIVAVNFDGIWMRRSNRFQFGSNELMAEKSSVGPISLVDINGDKRADAVEVASDGLRVQASRTRDIKLRFVQFTADGVAHVTNSELDNVINTANTTFGPAGIKFVRWASDVVTSAALSYLEGDAPPSPPLSATAAELQAAKNSFNPGCDIGNVSGVSEGEQVNRVATRCALPGELIVYVAPADSNAGFFPDHGKSIIMVPNDIITLNATNQLFAHELGHALGLPHVFTPGAKDPQTGVVTQSIMWDLVYKAAPNGVLQSFTSRAAAAAQEASLLPIHRQAPAPGPGWWCPSNDASMPCPAGAPLGTFVMPITNNLGVDVNRWFDHEIMKGLALQLPNRDRTNNIMTWNHIGNPSGIQERAAALSLSQIEQIRRVLTFNAPTDIQVSCNVAPGCVSPIPMVMNDRHLLGR